MHNGWFKEIYVRLLKCPLKHSSSHLHEVPPCVIVPDIIINPHTIPVNIFPGVAAVELWVVEGRPRL